MTFVKSKVICDSCDVEVGWQEYNDVLIDRKREPWVTASVNVRGYSFVLTYCPPCARVGQLLPRADEIVRRAEELCR